MSARVLKPFNSLSNNDFSYDLPAKIKLRGLLFFFSGVNSTGTPISRADLGRVEIMRDGATIDTALTFENMDALRAMYPRHEIGLPIFSSTGSSNLNASFYLPFHAPYDPSNVNEFSQRAVIRLLHNDLTSLASALQCQIIGVPDLGVEKYQLNFNSYTMQADSQIIEPRKVPNWKNILFGAVNFDSDHTNIRVSKDGKIIYDMSLTDLNSLSSLGDVINMLESISPADAYAEASSNFLPWHFRFDRNGYDSALGSDYGISVVSTDTLFSGYTASVKMNDETTRVSAENFAAKIARNRMRA